MDAWVQTAVISNFCMKTNRKDKETMEHSISITVDIVETAVGDKEGFVKSMRFVVLCMNLHSIYPSILLASTQHVFWKL